MLVGIVLKDAVGSVLIAGSVLVASTSGQGGGSLIVPILLLFYGFTPPQAVSLTNVTIFGGALASLVTNTRRKHPEIAHMPLIDYDAILMMEPCTMVGAILGSLVHRFLHSWQLLCFLDVVLVCLAAHAVSKAGRDWQATREYDEPSEATTEETESSDSHNDDESKTEDLRRSLSAEFQSLNARVHSVSIADEQEGGWAGLTALAATSSAYVDKRAVIISSVFLVVVALNLSKCSGGIIVYYAINVAICCWVAAVTTVTGMHLHQKWAQRPPPSAGVKWSAATAVGCPLISIAAGFFAGTFGIGGGFIKTPLLMFLGLPPEAAAATSSAMIFFTSLTATTSYFAFGHILYAYTAYFFLLGVGATAFGQFIGARYLARRHRAVVTQLCMGAIMGLSAVLLTLETLLLPHKEKPLVKGFEAFCGV